MPEVPYDIDGYLTEIDTGRIDADYMNSRFEKYLKVLNQDGIDENQKQQTLDYLHKSFAYLNMEEQKYATIFLHDVERGYALMENGKTFRDYVTEYQCKAKDDQIRRFSQTFGLDEARLRNIMTLGITEANLNEFGRFDELKDSVDNDKARDYFEKTDGTQLAPFKVNIKIHDLLRKFILGGGFEIA